MSTSVDKYTRREEILRQQSVVSKRKVTEKKVVETRGYKVYNSGSGWTKAQGVVSTRSEMKHTAGLVRIHVSKSSVTASNKAHLRVFNISWQGHFARHAGCSRASTCASHRCLGRYTGQEPPRVCRLCLGTRWGRRPVHCEN